MYSVTIEDFTPPPRFDGQVWTLYRIEEAASPLGPWIQIVSGALSPLDSDPTDPQARAFTFTTGLACAWYRVTFVDATGAQEQPSIPVHNAAPVSAVYMPTLQQVAGYAMSRTIDNTGVHARTFTETTQVTEAMARTFVQIALDLVTPVLGQTIPPETYTFASQAVAIMAAALIEINLFPEQVAANSSNYDRLITLYNTYVGQVQKRVADIEEQNGEDDGTGTGTMPHFNFDIPTTSIGPARIQGPVGWRSRW